MDRLTGLLAAAAYGLQRGRIGFARLHIVAGLALLLGAASAAYLGLQSGFTASRILLLVLCLVALGLLLWFSERRYLVFRPDSRVASDRGEALAADQRLFLRGSGFFEVSNMRRYLVEVPVVFWTTELAEHILAAKVRAVGILGIGVPAVERGWWYLFLDPPKVTEIVSGQTCFGLRCRPAVRVRYGEKGRDVLYLSCDTAEQLATLLCELRGKAEDAQRRSSRSSAP